MTEQDGATKPPLDASQLLEEAAAIEESSPRQAELLRGAAKLIIEGAWSDPEREKPVTVAAPRAPAEAPNRTTPIARVGSRAMLMPRDMNEAVEVAKLMSTAHGMVGPHLIGNPGGCLAVVLQAMNWGMSPFAVASKTYVAGGVPKDPNEPMPPISYEAQLIHAVVLSLAPTKGRPEIEFEGEGDEMRCIVTATFTGADKPSVLRSEPLAKLLPELNQYGKRKGSPLWSKKPEQQLSYNAVRDWARRFCPDVILGVYTPDEMQDFHIEERPRVSDPFAGEGPRQLTVGPSPMATAGTGSPEPVPVSSKDST